MCSYEGPKRTYSEIKSRSMHSRMPFPFASPCSLKGGIRAGVTDDRFNVVRAGIKRQPSLAAALLLLHWCWCCCWCKKVPGSTSQLERRRRLVLTLCQTGRRLWQASPELAHAPTAGLVLRNATLSCSAAREKFCATVPPCSLSYLQCRCALC